MLLDLLPLNEIAIAIVRGTSDQIRYAQVIVARIVGLRQGSRHQRRRGAVTTAGWAGAGRAIVS
jgi:hypothetical protein